MFSRMPCCSATAAQSAVVGGAAFSVFGFSLPLLVVVFSVAFHNSPCVANIPLVNPLMIQVTEQMRNFFVLDKPYALHFPVIGIFYLA